MKKFLSLILVALFLGNTSAEDKHQHHNRTEVEERHSVKSLVLNNGKKWDVDQTMQESMDAIFTESNKINQLIKSSKVSAKDYSILSDVIAKSAQSIVDKCNMGQKKDETFHNVLGELLVISEELKDIKKAKHAAIALGETLRTYTKYFDHAVH